MPPDQQSGLRFEIGHVLFIDIVGYSKLLINEQSELLQTAERNRARNGAIPRGGSGRQTAAVTDRRWDGALVFRNSPEAPVLCALEISKKLKSHPELHVRMGIHSGPVNEVD